MRTIFRLEGVHMGCNTPSMLPEPERPGQRKVFCVKFQREMPGLDEPPFDTELGRRIYENVSEEAWKMWGEHCKMLLNEYRLNPANRQDQEILVKHLEDFFFGAGAVLPRDTSPRAARTNFGFLYARSEGTADLDLRTGPATVWAGLARGVAARCQLPRHFAGPLATVAGRRGGTHRRPDRLLSAHAHRHEDRSARAGEGPETQPCRPPVRIWAVRSVQCWPAALFGRRHDPWGRV